MKPKVSAGGSAQKHSFERAQQNSRTVVCKAPAAQRRRRRRPGTVPGTAATPAGPASAVRHGARAWRTPPAGHRHMGAARRLAGSGVATWPCTMALALRRRSHRGVIISIAGVRKTEKLEAQNEGGEGHSDTHRGAAIQQTHKHKSAQHGAGQAGEKTTKAGMSAHGAYRKTPHQTDWA
jgi:hypothetical protein